MLWVYILHISTPNLSSNWQTELDADLFECLGPPTNQSLNIVCSGVFVPIKNFCVNGIDAHLCRSVTWWPISPLKSPQKLRPTTGARRSPLLHTGNLGVMDVRRNFCRDSEHVSYIPSTLHHLDADIVFSWRLIFTWGFPGCLSNVYGHSPDMWCDRGDWIVWIDHCFDLEHQSLSRKYTLYLNISFSLSVNVIQPVVCILVPPSILPHAFSLLGAS